jgi:predicted MFS family arabinose efflux permease
MASGAGIGDAGRPARSRRHAVGFWVIAYAFLAAMAFNSVPAPLYSLYMARDGFSTFMVTVVFAVYAVGVVVSLLLAGHVSDWVGRKQVLVPGLVLELVAAVLFLSGVSLPALLAGRLIGGLGVGMITATATAHLQDLNSAGRPAASGHRFELVSTAANIGGIGAGALVSGILAQWVSGPLRTPYLVFAVLLAVAVAAVALTPETVEKPRPRPVYRPQRISVNHGDRAGYFAAAAGAFAAFAVFGLFTSVAAGFVAGTLHHPSRALAGLTVFAVFGAAAVAQTLTGRMPAAARRGLGLLATAAGLVLLVAGMQAANLALFLAGGIVAGIGAGVLFKAAIGSVAAAAAPAERGQALAGIFLIAYLGLTVPVVAIGVATLSFSAVTVMTWFAGVLLVLLAGVAVLAHRTVTA